MPSFLADKLPFQDLKERADESGSVDIPMDTPEKKKNNEKIMHEYVQEHGLDILNPKDPTNEPYFKEYGSFPEGLDEDHYKGLRKHFHMKPNEAFGAEGVPEYLKNSSHFLPKGYGDVPTEDFMKLAQTGEIPESLMGDPDKITRGATYYHNPKFREKRPGDSRYIDPEPRFTRPKFIRGQEGHWDKAFGKNVPNSPHFTQENWDNLTVNEKWGKEPEYSYLDRALQYTSGAGEMVMGLGDLINRFVIDPVMHNGGEAMRLVGKKGGLGLVGKLGEGIKSYSKDYIGNSDMAGGFRKSLENTVSDGGDLAPKDFIGDALHAGGALSVPIPGAAAKGATTAFKLGKGGLAQSTEAASQLVKGGAEMHWLNPFSALGGGAGGAAMHEIQKKYDIQDKSAKFLMDLVGTLGGTTPVQFTNGVLKRASHDAATSMIAKMLKPNPSNGVLGDLATEQMVAPFNVYAGRGAVKDRIGKLILKSQFASKTYKNLIDISDEKMFIKMFDIAKSDNVPSVKEVNDSSRGLAKAITLTAEREKTALYEAAEGLLRPEDHIFPKETLGKMVKILADSAVSPAGDSPKVLSDIKKFLSSVGLDEGIEALARIDQLKQKSAYFVSLRDPTMVMMVEDKITAQMKKTIDLVKKTSENPISAKAAQRQISDWNTASGNLNDPSLYQSIASSLRLDLSGVKNPAYHEALINANTFFKETIKNKVRSSFMRSLARDEAPADVLKYITTPDRLAQVEGALNADSFLLKGLSKEEATAYRAKTDHIVQGIRQAKIKEIIEGSGVLNIDPVEKTRESFKGNLAHAREAVKSNTLEKSPAQYMGSVDYLKLVTELDSGKSGGLLESLLKGRDGNGEAYEQLSRLKNIIHQFLVVGKKRGTTPQDIFDKNTQSLVGGDSTAKAAAGVILGGVITSMGGVLGGVASAVGMVSGYGIVVNGLSRFLSSSSIMKKTIQSIESGANGNTKEYIKQIKELEIMIRGDKMAEQAKSLEKVKEKIPVVGTKESLDKVRGNHPPRPKITKEWLNGGKKKSDKLVKLNVLDNDSNPMPKRERDIIESQTPSGFSPKDALSIAMLMEDDKKRKQQQQK